MSDNCNNIDFLQRDGTSKQQRLLKALLPEYVSVDERKIDDLKAFVLKYAKEIRYYDLNSAVNGDWESFFNKHIDPDQRTEPHYALFLAFLQLFKIAQNDLNQITRKHLDFYYREVLKLEQRKAVADQVFIIFKLAKHVNQHLIEKGTRLMAGKDDSGKELIYEIDRDIVINTAFVEKIKAVFKDDKSRIYASPIANSADGMGAEIKSKEMSWRTFGKPEGEWPEKDRTQTEIGFAFASPILFLAEGDREITITLALKDVETTPGLTEVLKILNLREAFRARFSGEEKWIEPLIEDNIIAEDEDVPQDVENRILNFLNSANSWEDIAGVEPQAGPAFDDPATGYGDQINDYDIGEAAATEILNERNALRNNKFASLGQVRNVYGVGVDKINDLIYTFRNPINSTVVDHEKKKIIIKCTITKAQDPIVAYVQNDKTLLDPFITKWPVVKITLRTDRDPYVYEKLQNLIVDKANISVRVTGVRELIVQNDQSVLDPGKVFQPFGSQPEIGSGFYIGSREVFSKQLKSLKMHLLWHGLPDESFSLYYQVYIGNNRDNDSFKTNIHLLDKKEWVSLTTEGLSLFESNDSNDPLDRRTLIIDDSEALENVKRDIDIAPFDTYDTDSKKGFLRLQLSDFGTDFGHDDYQSSYMKQVLTALDNGGIDPTIPMPNEPYTPSLNVISLDYTSSVTFNVSTTKITDENQTEQFFHVGAFGVAEQKAAKPEAVSSQSISLFPQYKSEGSLYIGVQDFTSGQTLSVLFQVAEGSADPDLEAASIRWSYLSHDRWISFGKFDLLSDSTNGLLTSGIINFDISEMATDQNTLLPSGLHWLRATADQNSDSIPDLIQITAQAVTATFEDQGNDPGHLEEPLPAGTISKLKVADSAIDEILQPFASFGGKTTEQKSSFYTRISERLRHKSRAITIWDYERLVLEQFASVYKVKCLSHTRYTGDIKKYSAIAPGHVTLIIISNVKNKNAIDPLRPKTSIAKLSEIKEFVSKLNSISVELHVKNPIYEEIQVSLNVKFYPGYDNGFYGKKLEDDLKVFLSPWMLGSASELKFGGKIDKSVILNYVEERSYVDFITCFEMYHIIKNPVSNELISRTKVNRAIASTSISVLGSVGQAGRYGDHAITVLETDDCECPDNEVKSTKTIASIDECACDENQLFEI